MSRIHNSQMGSSPMGSGSAENGATSHGSITPISIGARSQASATPAGNTPNRESFITSINDNPDIETSAALLGGGANTELPAAHGGTHRAGISARRLSNLIHSEPIDIPARGNGNGHADTSPIRSRFNDELTPGRPPSTGPRRVAGTAQDLLSTPIAARRGVSPTFERLMSPGSYLGRSPMPTPVRPRVSSTIATPSTDAHESTQAEVGEQIVTPDIGSRDHSSVRSCGGRGGDHVVEITSPTDGIPLPVVFPETSAGPSHQRGPSTGTVRRPRATRLEYNGTGTVRAQRGIRDISLLSSSATSLMPRSSYNSLTGTEDENGTIRANGSGRVRSGHRAHPPMMQPVVVLPVREPFPSTYPCPSVSVRDELLTPNQSSDSSSSLSSLSTTDVERQPMLNAAAPQQHRSYGTAGPQDQHLEGGEEGACRREHVGFWFRFTRSEAVLFSMFLCSVVFGFTFMAMVMVHLLRD
ncbi:uncharacterized protein GGS22DRAFT_150524 [Annulohypoxylon maeteangense]|uniref:uncharacterized protein n=1 Tax=Annulohypoxylon maeteangense TaxID=1927788 RepID=UPI0020078404|nr:uncharacterized protein GGS22DRAFT_150524 [Annulohypoxylon maeteangense]KAI0890303.1 hypothetical protein GGS22DRAFT_150524 [Annulohypoxylon maeteangense]